MKIKSIITLVCVALCTVALASCNKEMEYESIDRPPVSGESVSVKGLVGIWEVPESEWLVEGKQEIWEFTEDGKYYHRQLNSDGGTSDSVDGEYRIDGDSLVLTVSGWEQPACIVVFPDSDTMAYTNHEKTIMLKRAQ